MFCSQCGANIPDNSQYCNICGKSVNFEQRQNQQSNIYYKNTKCPNEKLILIFGIISLACGLIPGIVFGSITRHFARDYIKIKGTSTKKVDIGNTLGKYGIIRGIVTTVIYFILYLIIYTAYYNLIIHFLTL